MTKPFGLDLEVPCTDADRDKLITNVLKLMCDYLEEKMLGRHPVVGPALLQFSLLVVEQADATVPGSISA